MTNESSLAVVSNLIARLSIASVSDGVRLAVKNVPVSGVRTKLRGNNKLQSLKMRGRDVIASKVAVGKSTVNVSCVEKSVMRHAIVVGV